MGCFHICFIGGFTGMARAKQRVLPVRRLRLKDSRIMQEKTILSGSKPSIALSIVVALIFCKGFEFVIQAMSLPLETAAARVVNAVLAHGWPNSRQLNEPHYPLMMVAYTAM